MDENVDGMPGIRTLLRPESPRPKRPRFPKQNGGRTEVEPPHIVLLALLSQQFTIRLKVTISFRFAYRDYLNATATVLARSLSRTSMVAPFPGLLLVKISPDGSPFCVEGAG